MARDGSQIRNKRGGWHTAKIEMEHLPRIIRIMKNNQGLTLTQLNQLPQLKSFKSATLRTVLWKGKQLGKLRSERQSTLEEAKWYTVEEECQTNPTIEEQSLNTT